MAEEWIAYDAISGDIVDSGSESRMKYLYHRDDAGAVALAPDMASYRRAARAIMKTMSGNPPRDRRGA